MENEYMKRGYLLPPGCKDLADVLKHKQNPVPGVILQSLPQISEKHWTVYNPVTKKLGTTYDPTLKFWKSPVPLPPIKGQVFIPPHTTVKELAALLGQKTFQIIGDLMQLELGMFATPDFLLDFKTISKVARMYGFMAIKAT